MAHKYFYFLLYIHHFQAPYGPRNFQIIFYEVTILSLRNAGSNQDVGICCYVVSCWILAQFSLKRGREEGI